MDGRGRFLDNIFVERLWRTVKYEEVYLKDYMSVPEAVSNLTVYFRFYNQERGHQVFDYQTRRGRLYFQSASEHGIGQESRPYSRLPQTANRR